MKPLLLLASFAALACAQSPAGDAKHGKDLFLSYACYSCHSFDGHGGAGARLVPMPLNQAAFIAFVRNAGRMPNRWALSASTCAFICCRGDASSRIQMLRPCVPRIRSFSRG